MGMPDTQSIMLPLLEAVANGKSHSLRELTTPLADKFGLNDEERQRRLMSGALAFANRVAWARLHLIKATLMESPARGMVRITDLGKKALANRPPNVSSSSFSAGLSLHSLFENESIDQKKDEKTVEATPPEEMLETSYQQIRASLAEQLLAQMRVCSPAFFERLVVDLLVAMGYGGSQADAGKAIGRSGDEGIDGEIKEDKLGLDVVYIQAKRWANNVGFPDVASFAGSLDGKRARKGVMITTSEFTRDAQKYVERIEKKIVLINGARLAELMIDHDIGVAKVKSYEVKKLDLDYFEEAEA